MDFPVGASVEVQELEASPYRVLMALRRAEPVSWVPAISTWLITGRNEAVQAMNDAERFTVNDPRFTTALVLGDSMLNLEGAEHARHRGAFSEFFRPTAVREGFDRWLAAESQRLIEPFLRSGEIELRTELAGPLAVNTITRFLGLEEVDSAAVLSWYQDISDAIVGLSLGREVAEAGRSAVDMIRERVQSTLTLGDHDSLIRTIQARGQLTHEELAPAVAVVMFGAIETSEGMTANVFWHLLNNPATLERVAADRALVASAVEESLRLEPAAAVVDRYTTTDLTIGGVTIPEGDPVSISLLAANRDPSVFADPDIYEIDRPNLRQHLSFVQGPHRCIGEHLARAETAAALNGVLDLASDLCLISGRSSPPSGLVFRKPAAVAARLTPRDSAG
ncbi:MAG: cytochrome P450 [Acidimicrobiales bacterium]